MTINDISEYWTISELAEALKIPKQTLYNWRAQTPPKGPKGFRVGKHLRYRRADVEAWIDGLGEFDASEAPLTCCCGSVG